MEELTIADDEIKGTLRVFRFACADLANLVNEAAILAARRGKDPVEMTDFDEATDRIVAGLEKKTRVMKPGASLKTGFTGEDAV